MIEVERKFRANSLMNAKVVAWLNAHGAFEKDLQYQVDTVFLIRSDSFKDFTKGDPVVRLRIVNNDVSLAYKRAMNESGDAVEHEMKVESFDIACAMLADMGYKIVTEIRKHRKEYVLQDITVTLDEVEGLGLFLEIEAICQPGEEAAAETKVAGMADALGLGKEDVEPKKYDVLLAEKRHALDA